MNARTRTARRHDPCGPTLAEADFIRHQRERELRGFCRFGTAIALLLMALHIAGVGL